MSRTLKSLHYASLTLGLLTAVGVIFNLIIFSILFPQITQLMEFQPRWETYGIVAAINIIILAFFQVLSVITLIAHLIILKRTSTLVILAIVTGILSGIMILGDIALLSDIGSQYEVGWHTIQEWTVLFVSYGLHIISLIFGLIVLVRNLHQTETSGEIPLKDEVLIRSMQSSGVICGAIGLVGVIAGMASNLNLWMMERVVVILSLITISPYLITLLIWLFRRQLSNVEPKLDERQAQGLSKAGFRTLIVSLFAALIFFVLQLSSLAREGWPVLWFPLLVFISLTLFCGLSLVDFRTAD